jgi:hypothetical protein
MKENDEHWRAWCFHAHLQSLILQTFRMGIKAGKQHGQTNALSVTLEVGCFRSVSLRDST